MKRPLLVVLICFIAGVSLYAIFGSSIYAAILALALIIKPNRTASLIIGAVFVLIGSLCFSCQVSEYDRFANTYEGRYCIIYGRIQDISREEDKTVKYVTVKSELINSKNESNREAVKILVYTDNRNVQLGNRVMVRGIVTITDKSSGITGFDYKTYLRSENISAVMYANDTYFNIVDINDTFYNRFLRFVRNNAFTGIMPEENAAFMHALVTGNRDGFTESMKNDFAASGIYHVVAISGMHINIMIMFITVILRRTVRGYKARKITSFFCILLYLAAVGASPSALRAGIMGMLLMLSEALSRRSDFPTSLALSAAIMLLVNPHSVYNVGFLLSYAAVIGIGVYNNETYERLPAAPSMIKAVVSMSAASEIATLPIRINTFHTINIYGMIANVIVLPFITILYVLGFLSTICPYLMYIFAPIINLLSTCVLLSIHGVASLHRSVIALGEPGPLLNAAAVMLVFTAFTVVKGNYKISLLMLYLNTVLFGFAVVPKKEASVTFLNVEQGDSAVIKCENGKNYMIDTGRDNGMAMNGLRALGIRKLDTLFISHIDDDHSGGASDILQSVDVETLVFPYVTEYNAEVMKLQSTAISLGTNVKYAAAGENFEIDGGSLSVMSPPHENISEDNTNENSLVLKLTLHNKTFMFMGDAGFLTEKTLDDVKCDVLKVGHHGSRYSTSEEFLKKADPDIAVLSYGENSFGHPSKEVSDKLSDIKAYHTEIDGSIEFKINKNGGEMKIGCK